MSTQQSRWQHPASLPADAEVLAAFRDGVERVPTTTLARRMGKPDRRGVDEVRRSLCRMVRRGEVASRMETRPGMRRVETWQRVVEPGSVETRLRLAAPAEGEPVVARAEGRLQIPSAPERIRAIEQFRVD